MIRHELNIGGKVIARKNRKNHDYKLLDEWTAIMQAAKSTAYWSVTWAYCEAKPTDPQYSPQVHAWGDGKTN